MIANLKKTIVEMKDIIRQKYKAEIKGIFGSYTRVVISTQTAIWISW